MSQIIKGKFNIDALDPIKTITEDLLENPKVYITNYFLGVRGKIFSLFKLFTAIIFVPAAFNNSIDNSSDNIAIPTLWLIALILLIFIVVYLFVKVDAGFSSLNNMKVSFLSNNLILIFGWLCNKILGLTGHDLFFNDSVIIYILLALTPYSMIFEPFLRHEKSKPLVDRFWLMSLVLIACFILCVICHWATFHFDKVNIIVGGKLYIFESILINLPKYAQDIL